MFYKTEIEDMILGMAEIVLENRRLRKENNELKLECAKHRAYTDSYFNEQAKIDYDILCDIENNNASVNMCESLGWSTSQNYIEDWRFELKRRKAALKDGRSDIKEKKDE